MPKIVNHETYKKELIEKATKIFRTHGYTGLGMRKMAELMGISKSALYHYFSSKEVLFAACAHSATSLEAFMVDKETVAQMSEEQRVDKVIEIFQSLEKDFKGELSLIIDYTRGLTADQIKELSDLNNVNLHYLSTVAYFVGEKNAQITICILYGVLLQRLFDGQDYPFLAVREQLISLVEITAS